MESEHLAQSATEFQATTYHPSDGASAKCGACMVVLSDGDRVKQLPCQHEFHAQCLDGHLATELGCPVCKKQVLYPMAKPAAPLPAGAQSGMPFAVPLDGTDTRSYGICRGCHNVFYRNPTSVRPETSGWYRCEGCRGTDPVRFAKAICTLQ